MIFFGFIMLENVIMMQHAVQYTFDRMKLVYLLIILFWISSIAIYVNLKSERKIYISLIGVAIAIAVNFVRREIQRVFAFHYLCLLQGSAIGHLDCELMLEPQHGIAVIEILIR